MENNKYFKPDVEDIQFGYEFESPILDYSCQGEGCPKEWVKEILGKPEDLDLRDGTMPRIPYPNMIRVQYLTKEQIEDGGWKLDDYSFIIMDVTDDNRFGNEHMYRFFKEQFSIIFHNENRTITIYNGKDVIYKGECKSINEFRYITRNLLNIK